MKNPLFEGLCGLKTDDSPSEIPATFALIEGERRPEIAISLRYYCYLAGLPTKTGIELLPADPAGDVRVRLFHEFCEQFEQSDGGEKALEIARQMVRLSSDQFRIPVDGINLFPILRGHCRLFEADALCRLKRFPEAVIAVDNAEKDWQAFNKQIEDLGLDTRYFWPERIGFEHLKQRLLSVVATGSPH